MSPESRGPEPGGRGAAALPVVGGRYEVGEQIGESHFYRVYRGRDVRDGRAVAVKVLQPEFNRDAEFSDRLRAESQAAISLSHPNIAQTYEAWEENGTTFVVTEFVRGINLKERIKRVAPFPLAVAIDIAVAVADALDYAARAGFVHGDVRPENILISPEGQVKITDIQSDTGVTKLFGQKKKKTCAASEIENRFRRQAIQTEILNARDVDLQPVFDIGILCVSIARARIPLLNLA